MRDENKSRALIFIQGLDSCHVITSPPYPVYEHREHLGNCRTYDKHHEGCWWPGKCDLVWVTISDLHSYRRSLIRVTTKTKARHLFMTFVPDLMDFPPEKPPESNENPMENRRKIEAYQPCWVKHDLSGKAMAKLCWFCIV